MKMVVMSVARTAARARTQIFRERTRQRIQQRAEGSPVSGILVNERVGL
jgi:hypothetical protein